MKDVATISGRLSIQDAKTGEYLYHPKSNTVTYAGFQWFLKQAMGAYGSSWPINGIRIGNGGNSGAIALTNDPTLTDVRRSIIGTIAPAQEYLPLQSVSFSAVSPYVADITGVFSPSLYNVGDFNGRLVINEAALWVPNVGAVTYTVLKTDSGALVEVPVIDSLELLFTWELRVQ